MRHTDVQGEGTGEVSARDGTKGAEESAMAQFCQRAAIVAFPFAPPGYEKLSIG
jgi:hypothetical protein